MNQTQASSTNKFGYPPVNLPFIDAQRRRLCFRNERSLYTRKCDATGDTIISVYSSDKPYTIYKGDYWYGDNWNALDYGRDFDFNRPFFEQFAELDRQVPRLALMNSRGINSDYCNMTVGNKNCYLVFGGDFNEDCLYGTLCMHNNTCVDLDYGNNNSLCYELCDSINCYGSQFVFDSKGCNNCYFISDCTGCTECILCTNLVQKSYCIGNQQYTKEEYLAKKAELINGSKNKFQELFAEFLKLRANRAVKFSHTINCQNCTGDYLKNSKNCFNCFDASDSEDLQNVVFASKAKDCHECSLLGENAELCYNTISSLKSYNVRCSFFTLESQNIEYSKYTLNSQDLFGCVGLRQEKHCILNKKYSPEEYQQLRAQIITHMQRTPLPSGQAQEWGSFFPPQLSDFAYNETSAQDYFPLNEQQATAAGYKWKTEELKQATPPSITLPDNIKDTPTIITQEVLQCGGCQKNYKIAGQEFAFYQKNVIPIPDLCESCRHKRRMQMRNPRYLWSRNCQECSVNLHSSYAPEKTETVLCENCYLKKVY